MRLPKRRHDRLFRDRRGFTRLEFSLLTGMLCAMIINGIATLGGGLGSSGRPLGGASDERFAAGAPVQPTAPHTP